MKILGIIFGKTKSNSTQLLVIDESPLIRRRQAQIRDLVSALSQIRDNVELEIEGRCRLMVSFGLMSGKPKSQLETDYNRMKYELRTFYPFIHSLSDKDRESASPEESQEKIDNAVNAVFGFDASPRSGMSLSALFPMLDAFAGQQRHYHEMTRQEREANNGRKPKRLTDGHLMLFPYPSDSNDNQHAENKSTEKQ